MGKSSNQQRKIRGGPVRSRSLRNVRRGMPPVRYYGSTKAYGPTPLERQDESVILLLLSRVFDAVEMFGSFAFCADDATKSCDDLDAVAGSCTAPYEVPKLKNDQSGELPPWVPDLIMHVNGEDDVSLDLTWNRSYMMEQSSQHIEATSKKIKSMSEHVPRMLRSRRHQSRAHSSSPVRKGKAAAASPTSTSNRKWSLSPKRSKRMPSSSINRDIPPIKRKYQFKMPLTNSMSSKPRGRRRSRSSGGSLGDPSRRSRSPIKAQRSPSASAKSHRSNSHSVSRRSSGSNRLRPHHEIAQSRSSSPKKHAQSRARSRSRSIKRGVSPASRGRLVASPGRRPPVLEQESPGRIRSPSRARSRSTSKLSRNPSGASRRARSLQHQPAISPRSVRAAKSRIEMPQHNISSPLSQNVSTGDSVSGRPTASNRDTSHSSEIDVISSPSRITDNQNRDLDPAFSSLLSISTDSSAKISDDESYVILSPSRIKFDISGVAPSPTKPTTMAVSESAPQQISEDAPSGGSLVGHGQTVALSSNESVISPAGIIDGDSTSSQRKSAPLSSGKRNPEQDTDPASTSPKGGPVSSSTEISREQPSSSNTTPNHTGDICSGDSPPKIMNKKSSLGLAILENIYDTDSGIEVSESDLGSSAGSSTWGDAPVNTDHAHGSMRRIFRVFSKDSTSSGHVRKPFFKRRKQRQQENEQQQQQQQQVEAREPE